MSITTSLSNALSGLSAASRGAEVVSSNVANSLTEGYGTRDISLTARFGGGIGGVAVVGETRQIDAGLLSDRRLSDAQLGFSSGMAGYLSSIESMIGLPGEDGSLTDLVADLEASFLQATSFPQSEPHQQEILSGALNLANRLNEMSAATQAKRIQADRSIGDQVSFLNNALQQVVDLNADIQSESLAGVGVSGLLDQRQQVIDSIADLVPIREVPRAHGRVALITTGGIQLVDGPAAVIGFSPSNTIVADMSIGAGSLSGLTVNGRALSENNRGMDGGAIAANFQIRDELAVQTQARLDSMARDLIERFEDPAVDPTLGVGDPGLFTDRGAVFDPLTEQGLAGRLSINAAVNPSEGGALFRFRDGIGAVAAGPVGDTTLLQNSYTALTQARAPSSVAITGTDQSIQSLAAEFLSQTSLDKYTQENNRAFAETRNLSLAALEKQGGVDTDEQMQKLLLIEQAYGANARVIQTIDELIQTLIRI